MSDSKIVFIVGAGASEEVGLPTGGQLKNLIATKLDIQYDIHRISGEVLIDAALREHVKGDSGECSDISPYLHAGWHIRDAMPQAMSIDNFIDQQNDDKIELCGKLAIVHSILEAERQSFFAVSQNTNRACLINCVSGHDLTSDEGERLHGYRARTYRRTII